MAKKSLPTNNLPTNPQPVNNQPAVPSAFDIFAAGVSQTSYDNYFTPASQVGDSKYNSTGQTFGNMDNIYDQRNLNQGGWDRFGNALGKIGTRALSSTLEGVGILYGASGMATPEYLAKKIVSGEKEDVSGLWNSYKNLVLDNSLTDLADIVQEFGDENFQQQFSAAQRADDGVSIKRMIQEGLPDTLGYILPIVLTGGEGAVAKLGSIGIKAAVGGTKLPTVAKLFGKLMATRPKETAQILSAASKGANITDDLINLASKAKWTNTRELLKSSFTSSLAEAAAEGRATKKELEQQLVDDYMLRNGLANESDIDSFVRQSLKDQSNNAGLLNIGINSAILTASNLLAFPTYFKKFQHGKRELGKFINGGGTADELYGLTKRTVGQKVFGATGRAIKNFASQGSQEALQELLQTSSNNGIKDYYRSEFSEEGTKDAFDAVMGIPKLLIDTAQTTEGIEGMILGGLVGGAPSVVTEELNRQFGDKKEAAALVSALNNSQAKSQFPKLFKGITDNISTQKKKDAALAADDIFTFKNEDHRQIFDYMNLRLDIGRESDIKNDIDNLRNPNVSELDKMFGAENSSIEGFSYSELADKLEEKLKEVKETRDKVNLNYTTLNKDVKDNLMFYASAVKNFDKREAQLVEELAKQTGVDAETIREVYKSYKDTDEVDYKDVILRAAKKKFNVDPILDSLDSLSASLGLSEETKKAFSDFETEKKKTNADFQTDLDSLFKIITGEASATASVFSGDKTNPANSINSSVIDESAFTDEYNNIINSAKSEYKAKIKGKSTAGTLPVLYGTEFNDNIPVLYGTDFGDASSFDNEKINKIFADLKKVADTRETYYGYYQALAKSPYARERLIRQAAQDKERYETYISQLLKNAPVKTEDDTTTFTSEPPFLKNDDEEGEENPNEILNGSALVLEGDEESLNEGELGLEEKPNGKNPNPPKGNPPTGGQSGGQQTSSEKWTADELRKELDKLSAESKTLNRTPDGKAYLFDGAKKLFRRVTSVIGSIGDKEFAKDYVPKTFSNSIDLGNRFDKLAKFVFSPKTQEPIDETALSVKEKELLKQLKEIESSLRVGSNPVIEFYTDLRLANKNGLNVAGELDLLALYADGSVQVIDFKSGITPPASYLPQMAMYSSLLFKNLSAKTLNLKAPFIIKAETLDSKDPSLKIDSNDPSKRKLSEFSGVVSRFTEFDKKEFDEYRKFYQSLLKYEGTKDSYYDLPLLNKETLEKLAAKYPDLNGNINDLYHSILLGAGLENTKLIHRITKTGETTTSVEVAIEVDGQRTEFVQVSYLPTSLLEKQTLSVLKGIEAFAKGRPMFHFLRSEFVESINEAQKRIEIINEVADSLKVVGDSRELKIDISYEPNLPAKKQIDNFESELPNLLELVNSGELPVGTSLFQFTNKTGQNKIYGAKDLTDLTNESKDEFAFGLNSTFPIDKWILKLPSFGSTPARTIAVRPIRLFQNGTTLNEESQKQLFKLKKLLNLDKNGKVILDAAGKPTLSTYSASDSTAILNDLVYLPTQAQYDLKGDKVNYDLQISIPPSTSKQIEKLPTDKGTIPITFKVTKYVMDTKNEIVPLDVTFTGYMLFDENNFFQLVLSEPDRKNDKKDLAISEFSGQTNTQIFEMLLSKTGAKNKGIEKNKDTKEAVLNRDNFLLGSPTSASQLIPLLGKDELGHNIRIRKEITGFGEKLADGKGQPASNQNNTQPDTESNNQTDNSILNDIDIPTQPLNEKGPEAPPFSLNDNNPLVDLDLEGVRERLSKILPSWVQVNSILSMIGRLNLTGAELGMVYKNAIYLNSKIEKGTEYHEAFHIIFGSLLSQKQREELLQEEFNRSPVSAEEIALFKESHPAYKVFSDKTALERILEERLADKFQKHQVKKDETSLTGRFFNYLRNLVNSLFDNRSKLDILFDQISEGKFKNSAIPVNNDVPVKFKTLPQMKVTNSDYMVRWITTQLQSDIRKKIEQTEIEDQKNVFEEMMTTKKLTDLVELFYKEAGQELTKEEYEKLDISRKNEYVASKSKKVYYLKSGYFYETKDTNTGLTIRQTFLNELSSEISKKMLLNNAFDEDTKIIINGESEIALTKNYDAENNTVGGFHSLNGKVKAWLDSLSYIEDTKQKRRRLINTPVIHSRLVSSLADSISPEALVAKLKSMAYISEGVKRDPEIAAVYDSYLKATDETKLLFLQAYDKVYMNSLTGLISSKADQVLVDLSDSTENNESMKQISENSRAAEKTYLGKFQRLFSSISEQKKANKERIFSTEELEEFKTKVNSISSKEISDPVAVERVLDELKETLKSKIGLDLSKETLRENYVNEPLTKDGIAFGDSVVGILTSVIDKNLSPYLTEKGDSGQRKRITTIVLSEIKFSEDPVSTLTFKDAANKPRYAIAGNFEEKQRLSTLQKDREQLPKLLKNPYFRLSPFFGKRGVKKLIDAINISYVNGVSYLKTKTGKKTFKDFAGVDHIASKLSLYMKGQISPFVHEAGSTQTVYDLSELFKKGELLDRSIVAKAPLPNPYNDIKYQTYTLADDFFIQFAGVLKQDLYLATQYQVLLNKAEQKLAELQEQAKSENKSEREKAKNALWREDYLEGLTMGVHFEYKKVGERNELYTETDEYANGIPDQRVGLQKVKFLEKHRTFNSFGKTDFIKMLTDKVVEIKKEAGEEIPENFSVIDELLEKATDTTTIEDQINEILDVLNNNSKYASVFGNLRDEFHKLIKRSVEKEMFFSKEEGLNYIDQFPNAEDYNAQRNQAEDFLYEKAVRSFLGSTYINQMISGYSGGNIIYKNFTDVAKRSKNKSSNGATMAKYAFVHNKGKNADGIINYALIPDTIIDSFHKIDGSSYEIVSTDGSAYVSSEFMKIYMKSTVGLTEHEEKLLDIMSDVGKWNDIIRAGGLKNYLYEELENAKNSFKSDDVKAIEIKERRKLIKALDTLDLAPKKSFIADPGKYDTLEQGGEMFKIASFILTPELVYARVENGTRIPHVGMEKEAQLLYEMATKNIQSVVHLSGSKAAKRNVSVFDRKKEGRVFLRSFPMSMEHVREQVRMESGKTIIVDSTQRTALIDADANRPELTEEYQTLLGSIRETSQNLYSLSNSLLTETGGTVYGDAIKNQLEAKRRGDNIMELLSGKPVNGVHKYNFSPDLNIINSSFEEAITSLIGKNVNRQTVTGTKVSIAPGGMMTYEVDENGNPTYDVIRQKDKNRREKLKVHRYENGEFKYAEVIISEELLSDMDISKKEFLKLSMEEQQDMLKMVGCRIPTQAGHSIIPIKVVGFVPKYYGSVIYMSPEAVAIMGADYDIDSLFVTRKKINLVRRKEGNPYLLTHKKNEKDRKDSWVQYILDQPKFKGFVKKYLSENKIGDKTLKKSDLLSDINERDKFFDMLVSMNLIGSKKDAYNYYSPYQQQNRLVEINLDFLTNLDEETFNETAVRPAGTSLIKNVADVMADFLGFSGADEFSGNFPSEQQESQVRNTVGKKNVAAAVSVGVSAIEVLKNPSDIVGPQSDFGLSSLAEKSSPEVEIVYDKNTKRIQIVDSGREVPKSIAISDLESATTDDSKENNAFKLNITDYTVSKIPAGIAVGIGVTRSLLVNATPIIKYVSGAAKQGRNVFQLKSNFSEVISEFIDGYEDQRLEPVSMEEDKARSLTVLNKMLVDSINFYSTPLGEKIKTAMFETNSFVFSEEALKRIREVLETEQDKKEFAKFLMIQQDILNLFDHLSIVSSMLLKYREVNSAGNKELGTELSVYEKQIEVFEEFEQEQFELLDEEIEGGYGIKRRDGKPAITENGRAIYRNAKRVIADSQKYTVKTNTFFKRAFNVDNIYSKDIDARKKKILDFFLSFMVMKNIRTNPKMKNLPDIAYEYLFSNTNDVVKQIKNVYEANPETKKFLENNLFWKKLETTEKSESDKRFSATVKFESFAETDPAIKAMIIEDAERFYTYINPSDFPEMDKDTVEKLSKDVLEIGQLLLKYELIRSALGYRNNSYSSILPAKVFRGQSEFLENIRDKSFNTEYLNDLLEQAKSEGKETEGVNDILTLLELVSKTTNDILGIKNPDPIKNSISSYFKESLTLFFQNITNRLEVSATLSNIIDNKTFDMPGIKQKLDETFKASEFGNLPTSESLFTIEEGTRVVEKVIDGKTLRVREKNNWDTIDIKFKKEISDDLDDVNKSKLESLLSSRKPVLIKNTRSKGFLAFMPMVIRFSYNPKAPIYIRDSSVNTINGVISVRYKKIDLIEGMEYLPLSTSIFNSGEEAVEFLARPESVKFINALEEEYQKSIGSGKVSDNDDLQELAAQKEEAENQSSDNSENEIEGFNKTPIAPKKKTKSVKKELTADSDLFNVGNEDEGNPETEVANSNNSTTVTNPDGTVTTITENPDGTTTRITEYQKSSAERIISLSAAEAICKRLSSKLNVPYKFVSGTGNWIGRFNTETGEVEINRNADIGIDTPFHEFLHPFLIVIQQTRPELYNSLVDQIIEEGTTLRDVSENYPELSQEQMIMEAIVTKIGKIAGGIFDSKKEQSLFEKVMSEIKSIISSILGINEDFVSLDNATSMFDIAQIMNDNNSYDISSLLTQSKETHETKLKMAVASLVKSNNLTYSCK